MSKIREFIRNISPFNNRTEMPKILYVIKVILIFYLFKFGSELVGEGLALAVHFACGMNPFEGEMFDENTITLITYLGYSVMIVIVFLLWKLFQKKTVSELGLTKNFCSYFIGIALGAVLLAVSVISITICGALQFNGVFVNIDVKMVLLLVLCFVFQGAMEEILCRGIVQQLLIKKTSVTVAFGVSAILFTVPHIGNMQGGSPVITAVAVINLILISLIFSLVTHRYKSIWAACGLHSVWNYILYSILGLNLSGKDAAVTAVFDMKSVGRNILNGAEYGIEASILTTVVLALTLGILLIYFRHRVLLYKRGLTEVCKS